MGPIFRLERRVRGRFASGLTTGLTVAVMLMLSGPSAAQSLPIIGFCNPCWADREFANQAIHAAPDSAPGNGTAVTYPVYVINPATGNIRYFDVLAWFDWGDGRPYSSQSADAVGSESGEQTRSFGLQKEAYPGPGDAQIILALQQAHVAALEFASALSFVVIDSTDIGFPGQSAIGLVGPETSAAGLDRLNLQNQLTDYYAGLRGGFFAGLTEMASRLGNRLLGGSGYVNPMSRIKVRFPDGTEVMVEVSNVSTSLDLSELFIDFEVMTETARLPDGGTVPQNGGQFDGFGYSGSSSVLDLIRDLAWRLGVTVSGGSGTRIACARVRGGGPVLCEIMPF